MNKRYCKDWSICKRQYLRTNRFKGGQGDIMSNKQFRVTITLDSKKDQDILEQLEQMAEKHQIGAFMSNLVRKAFDNSTPSSFSDAMTFGTLGEQTNRARFFKEVAGAIRDQDSRIDEIYSMCKDLYVQARANKALGLEKKAETLMVAQFVLQRQQDRIREILGEKDIGHVYESNKLLKIEEQTEKTWEYIAETYADMLAEIKEAVYMPVGIMTGVAPGQQQPGTQYTNQEVPQIGTVGTDNQNQGSISNRKESANDKSIDQVKWDESNSETILAWMASDEDG